MNENKAQREYEAYSQKVTRKDVDTIYKEEQSIFDKAKGPLNKFTQDFTLFFSIIKDYVHGVYKEIPWSAIAGIVGTLLYVFIPTDVIPDGIPLLGLTDDASVVLFCLKSLDEELQKYRQWKQKEITVEEPKENYMEITISLSNIDYTSLTETVLPLIFDSVEKKQKKSFKDRILLFFKKPVHSLAPKIVNKFDSNKIDEMVIKQANDNKQKIISLLQQQVEKNKIKVTVQDVQFKKSQSKKRGTK